MSLFKDKPGQHVCDRCGGLKGGCWHCQRTGLVTTCPQCSNQDPGHLHRNDDDIHCSVCGGHFSRSGELLHLDEEKDLDADT